MWYIAQLSGFLGLGLCVIAYLQKQDQRLRKILASQGCVMTLHFALLGAYGGMVAEAVTAIRNATSLLAKARPFAPLFLCTYCILGYFSYSEWYDLLPVIAACSSTLAVFYLKAIPMRLFLVITAILWLIHNIAVGSIGPSLMEIMNICAHFTTIYRLRRDKAQTAEHQQVSE